MTRVSDKIEIISLPSLSYDRLFFLHNDQPPISFSENIVYASLTASNTRLAIKRSSGPSDPHLSGWTRSMAFR